MATFSSTRYGRGPRQRRGETRRTGQWKLAYADFLTALCALFLALWVSSDTSAEERSAIAAYFAGDEQVLIQPSVPQQLESAINTAMLNDPALIGLADHIRLLPEPHGLRIELTDHGKKPLFALGGTSLNAEGERIIEALAPLLIRHDIRLDLEGHTDAFAAAAPGRSNWDLSSDRAHAARRVLIATGLQDSQILSVTGFAATRPLLPEQPHAAANRRISLIAHEPDAVPTL